MKHLSLFLIGLLAWFAPTFASAQDVQRVPPIEERVRSTEIDGHSFYRVRAEVNEPYANLMRVAAPGTTEEQLDALNVGYVNFVCREEGRRRIPPTRNGHFVDGGAEPTIDFATFASTRCADGEARRELVAGARYLIPREVIHSPSERLAEITTRINDAAPNEVRTVVSDTDQEASTLISEGVAPSATTAYINAVTGRLLGGDETVDPTIALRDQVDTLTVELADLRTQVETLTVERDTARAELAAAESGNWPWWVTLLAVLAAAIICFGVGRKTGRDAASKEYEDELRELGDLRKRITPAEDAAMVLNSLVTFFKKSTGKDLMLATLDAVVTESKSYAAVLMAWAKAHEGQAVVPMLEPETLKATVGEANAMRNMHASWRDAWTKAKHPKPPLLTIENIARSVERWAQIDLLSKVCMGFEPSFALSSSAPDGGFGAYITLREDAARQSKRESMDAHKLREDLGLSQELARANLRISELEAVNAAFDATNAGLMSENAELTSQRQAMAMETTMIAGTIPIPEIEKKVRAPLYALIRGTFGSVLSFDTATRRKVVDAKRVQDRFSHPRDVSGGKKKKGNGHAEATTIFESKGLELSQFLREVHDGFDVVLDAVDGLLGLGSSRHDPTPPPGSIAIPRVPAELAEASASEPGQDDLLEHPDETPTGEVDPLERQATTIAKNPLLATPPDEELAPLPVLSTEPFAKYPEEDEAHKSNGRNPLGEVEKGRGDEPTIVAKRKTDIGVGGSALKGPDPESIEEHASDEVPEPPADSREGEDEVLA